MQIIAGRCHSVVSTDLAMVFIYGSAVLTQPEAEFMKVSVHNLASSQTWSFRIYNVYIINQFQTTFARKEENSKDFSPNYV